MRENVSLIRIDKQTHKHLNKLAKELGINITTLASVLLDEKIDDIKKEGVLTIAIKKG